MISSGSVVHPCAREKALIYVSGYGRSGSTAVEIMLASHFEVLALGELERSWSPTHARPMCSCGDSVEDCAIWSSPHLLQGYVAAIKKRDMRELDLVLDLLEKQYGMPIVDASKNAWGLCTVPCYLARNQRVAVFHCMRSLSSVLRSVKKGRNRYLQVNKADPRPELLNCAIAILGWILSNAVGKALSLIFRNVVIIKYERLFTTDFKVNWEYWETVVGERLAGIKKGGGTRHSVAGNRVGANVDVK